MKFRFLLLSLAISVCLANPARALLKPGEIAPDFGAQTLEDRAVKLSDLKGKLLLVEMGTTWCPSCNELAHQIDSIRPFLTENDVPFISVYLNDSADSIRAHTKDEGLKSADQTLIDSGDARRNYSVFSIPRLLLIDKEFRIVFDEMMLDSSELKRRIIEQIKGNN